MLKHRRSTVAALTATFPLAAGLLSGCATSAADATPGQTTPASGATSQLGTGSVANSLPTPPQQNAPWQKPTGKDAEGLPEVLLNATETLFGQGLADPRGCEYKIITVQIGSVWSGYGGTVTTHGWVLPKSAETGGKTFAVCWNGLVYPVVAVKGVADANADIQSLVQKAKPKGGGAARYGYTLMWSQATPESASLSLEYPSLLKAVYLLRLGQWKAARDLYAVWEAGTPPRVNGNDDIRRDPYLLLASQWAWSAYDRAVCAHMRGTDTLAKADADLLTRVQPAIEAEAAKRGYKTYPNGGMHTEKAPFLTFLYNLLSLQQDATRRVTEVQPAVLDLKALKTRPQGERIATLIQHLQDIDARQSGQPGGVGLDADPVAQALIAEGDTAVGALLDTIEKDERLTRSVSFPRDFKQQRNLLRVKDAAFVCFARITDVQEIGQGQPTVAALRDWWAKNKGMSTADRWFVQLADDGAPTEAANTQNLTYEARTKQEQAAFEKTRNDQRRWSEAAARIVERGNITRSGQWVSIPSATSGQPLPPFKGESLRRKQNPSVSDLLRRRALLLSEPTEGRWGFDFASGATLALMLYEWDPNGAQTLPTLQTLMQRCLDFQNKQERGSGHSDQYQLGGRIARLTLARVRLGDTAATAEYKKYLQTVSPAYLEHETRSVLLPLWQEPKNPGLRVIADALFSEKNGAATPWNRLLADPKARDNYSATRLLASELLRVTSFCDLVVRRLNNKTEAGQAKLNTRDGKTLQISWSDSGGTNLPTAKLSSNNRITLRVCDRVAQELQQIQGVPRFNLSGSIAQRDTQCAAIAAFLKRYGNLIRQTRPYPSTLYGYDMGSGFDLGPVFPILMKPATATDVRDGRAIFALKGAKTRIVPDLPAPLPLEAEWSRDPNPSEAMQMDGKTVLWSRGLIWQVEDEWDGTEWRRYYGYVGPHSIARVPASEVKITDYRVQKPKLVQPQDEVAKAPSVAERTQ